jgi:hypothetical protein
MSMDCEVVHFAKFLTRAWVDGDSEGYTKLISIEMDVSGLDGGESACDGRSHHRLT